jgi:exopolysaccharide biosynthesis operon protein EpsL
MKISGRPHGALSSGSARSVSFRASLAIRSGLALLGILHCATAHAEGMLELSPYVSATVVHDDNIFRVSGKQEALALLGDDKMSDTVTILGAGLNLRAEVGRQLFVAGYGKTRTRFDYYSFQDSEGDTRNLGWNWRIGNHLFGEISSSESTSQSSFTEFQSVRLNLKTVRNDVYRANWELHPRWTVTLAHQDTTTENSAFTTSDKGERADIATLTYRTPAGNELALVAQRREMEFPGRTPVLKLLYGDSNQHREMAIKAKWQPSGKLQLNGQLGFFRREGEGPLSDEFSDINKRLDATWAVTGKTTLMASAWQEYRLADDLTLGFSKASGLRVSPAWQPTSRIQVRADASVEDVAYQDIARGDETLRAWGINASYLPHRKVSMQLGWRHEDRSTQQNALNDYDSDSLNASVRIDF